MWAIKQAHEEKKRIPACHTADMRFLLYTMYFLLKTYWLKDTIGNFQAKGGDYGHSLLLSSKQRGIQKRVRFMFGGKLERVRFRYTGPSLEVVLDRLSIAEIVEKNGNGCIIDAEVFGKDIKMRHRGQNSYVKRVP